MSHSLKMKPRAFTLIELLIVVAIIGVLAVLLLPAMQNMLSRGNDGKTVSNLRQIGAALIAYASDHQQLLPAAHATIPYQTDQAADPLPWQQQLDTYIGYTGASTETDGERKVFSAPTCAYRTNSFFLGSYAAGYATAKESNGGEFIFAPLNLQRITRPSMHVLGGEVARHVQFADNDADKDDYGDNDPAFLGASGTKVVQILFADGHVAGFKAFDPTRMTVRYEGVKEDGTGYSYSDP
ncbi:hypothetical protein DB345_04845 [Spartobacteria bacterium LR76]|nr:hypothetical protein DB345_04845 [Spartobacteria bacterium LR76]